MTICGGMAAKWLTPQTLDLLVKFQPLLLGFLLNTKRPFSDMSLFTKEY